jgi:hypothetical protein
VSIHESLDTHSRSVHNEEGVTLAQVIREPEKATPHRDAYAAPHVKLAFGSKYDLVMSRQDVVSSTEVCLLLQDDRKIKLMFNL